jgi:hypothetical protein
MLVADEVNSDGIAAAQMAAIGTSRQFAPTHQTGAIGGIADMPRSPVVHPGDANDPGCVKTPEARERLE